MTPGERALRDGVAVVEHVPRAVFAVTGERSVSYLHDVLAQDVTGIARGRGAIAAVLTANGRVAAEIRVFPLAERVMLDAEPAAASGVLEHVARHAPLAGVEVEDVSDRFAMTALRGPSADAALTGAGLPVPPPEEAAFDRSDDLLIVRVSWGVPGVDVIGPASAMPSISAERASLDELEAARIEAGRPRFGVDITEELLVNETPLLARGVSMSKGCYPGQESVARVHNLGRVRRVIRGLRSHVSLEPGAELRVDGAVVGRVTSATIGSDGGAYAIALVGSDIEPGATVDVGGAGAVVTDLA